MKIEIEINDVGKLSEKLLKTINEIRSKRNRNKILFPAATVAAKAIASATPVGKRRQTKRVRKAGKVVYYAGNLRKSIQRITGLRRSRVVVIGPFYNTKSGATEFGKTKKTASGYYAHMLYGSAEGFGRRITRPAMAGAASQILAVLEKKYREVARKEGRKLFIP